MAVFTGLKLGSDIELLYDSYASANLLQARSYYNGETLGDTAGEFSDAVSATPYPDPYSFSETGIPVSDFGNDWYERIHISPNQIDVGNLVSSQTRKIIVWNAFQTTKAFEDFQIENGQGLGVQEVNGISPPASLVPLQLLDYDLNISLSGPPSILSTLTWTIDGQLYQAEVVGRRVVLFPFLPNWNSGVNETIAYRSTVSRSFDGTEQRASLRKRPRRSFEYTAQIGREDAQLADSLLFGWQNRMFALPCWPEKSSTTSDVLAGAVTIPCDTSYRTFVVGGLAAMYLNSGKAEIREIESVTPSSITFTAPLEEDWPKGSRVYPVFVSAINPQVSGIRRTDNLVELPVIFECEPSTTDPNLPGEAAALLYQGEELYLRGANWDDGLSFDWNNDYEKRDEGTGVFSLFAKSGFSQFSRSHNWTLRSLADVLDFRGWLERREGRAVPIYMPSFFSDFTLATDLVSSATSIDVLPNSYDSLVNMHPARRDVVLLMRDGSHIARRILSVTTTAEGNIRLGLDSAIGVTTGKNTVKRVSFLGFYRLGGDAVTINWLAQGVATAETAVVATKA